MNIETNKNDGNNNNILKGKEEEKGEMLDFLVEKKRRR